MKLLSTLCCLFILLKVSFAQPTVSVMGRVIDNTTDEPIPDVVIIQNNSSGGTVTDSLGYFSLQVAGQPPYTISTRHVAYKPFELITSRTDTRGKLLIIHLVPLQHEKEEVVVTGNKTATQLDKITGFTGTINGKELDNALSATIAETIKDEAGISVRSMGPAPARPVIRGLGGDRITIMEDGFTAADLSATSPDHAVAIDPFTTYRIEVIRGPKVLLESFSAFGGIVNVIKETIPSLLPANPSFMIGTQAETANKGYTAGFSGKAPIGSFTVYSEASKRKTGDLITPKGTLKNSFADNYSYATGVSSQFLHGYAGMSLREFHSEYRVPGGFVGAHPNGVKISFFKREINAIAEYGFHHPYWEKVMVKAGRNFFSQQEFEASGAIGAEFGIKKYDATIRLDTKAEGNFLPGALQLSGEYRDFTIGGFVFTAPTINRTLAFAFNQQYSADDFLFEASARIGISDFSPKKVRTNQREEYTTPRNFSTYALSLSGLYSATVYLAFGLNISRSSRVPTIEELYSEGPHLAAYSYEVGNPSLETEKGIGAEFFTYWNSERLEAVLSIFHNAFSYFITPRNTGKINFQTLLPIYKTEGIAAEMNGFEFSLKFSPWESTTLSVKADYVHGKNKNIDAPLPQMPPFKYHISLSQQYSGILFSFEAEAAHAQNRVDLFESSTPGYITISCSVNYSITLLNLFHTFNISVENINNSEYRNHLSRVKVILPEIGRNFKFLYKAYF